MYIQYIKRRQGNKTYTSVILAESYRQDGKMKRRILANLTKWPEALVRDFRTLLKKGKVTEDLEYEQGKSCGALIVLKEIAARLGIIKALGNSKQSK